MTNILLKLQKKIPEHIRSILVTVFDISDKFEIKAFVVGATARDLIFEYVYDAKIYRATEDIDFGVAVRSWKEYELLKKALIETKKFRDDAKNEQRIRWIGDNSEMKVDLVPFGGLESPPGQIAFPPENDFVMSTVGLKEAFENSLLLEAGENLIVRIASLAGLVLLKFVAFNDRPHIRRRDVQDIFFIAQNYLDAGNEDRLYDAAADADLLDDENFDYQSSGARMLGRDVAHLLNRETKDIISRLLAEEANGGSLQKLADIIAAGKLQDEDQYEVITDIFRQLRLGIIE